jgi:hypothetical protein
MLPRQSEPPEGPYFYRTVPYYLYLATDIRVVGGRDCYWALEAISRVQVMLYAAPAKVNLWRVLIVTVQYSATNIWVFGGRDCFSALEAISRVQAMLLRRK